MISLSLVNALMCWHPMPEENCSISSFLPIQHQPVTRWAWQASHGQLTDVWADDQLAYVTFRAGLNETDTGLMIVDVSGPGVPYQVGEWTAFSYNIDDPVVSVSIAGQLAYLTQPFSGLRVVDVSVLAQPVELEQHFTPGSTWNVIATGNRVYVNTLEGGLSIYEMHGNAAGQTARWHAFATGAARCEDQCGR